MRTPALLLACAALVLGASIGANATAPMIDKDAIITGTALPKTLSEYGFFRDPAAQVPDAGVTPYRLNMPLFSDGAEKLRFVYVPDGAEVGIGDQTLLDFPVGSALIAFGSGETEGASLKGDLIAVGIVIVFSIGLTVARKLRPVSVVPAIPAGMLGAALVLFPFATPLSVPADDWIWVALHGGFFVTVSTALLATGPRFLPSAEVALLLLVESVLAPVLAWVVVGEDPGKWALIGGAVVIGALAVSNGIALVQGRRVAVKPGPPRA